MIADRRTVVVVAALALLGCGAESDPSPSAGEERAATVAVDMKDVEFVPNNVIVRRGTTVRWTNSDELLHTVTKTQGPGGDFDSGNVFPGKTYERRFDEAGRFDYVCILHDGQVGSVTVR